MLPVNSKLPGMGASIFYTMSRMAAEYNAINLSQGFPDFNCPAELISLFNQYQQKGMNQYAPMPGVPELREKLCRKIAALYGKQYNPDENIIITSGATEALYTAITCSVNPGDEVIMFEPAYDAYAPSVIASGGVPVFVPLADDFSIDWQRTKDSVTSRTRMIIVNSPHNPAGSVISGTDIKNLEDITRFSNIIVLSDEVYEHIVFDGRSHISIASSEELSERAFVISSFGKTYHTTGWKVGYCCAPSSLMEEFKKLHQYIVFAVNTPAQYAFADYLDNEKHYKSLPLFYQQKRNLLIDSMKDSRFTCIPAAGTYFQLFDYSAISNANDMDFCKHLIREAGVAAIPLSPFYSGRNNRKLIRLCFAKKDEVLLKAAERLKDL